MNREYRIRYDREHGKFKRTPVYGEGVFQTWWKILVVNYSEKRWKRRLQKGAEKAFENAATKTGDYAAKKAGNKIIDMLSKKQPTVRMQAPPTIKQRQNTETQLSQREINERVNRISSGGKLRKLM